MPGLHIAQIFRDDTYGVLRHAQNLLAVPGVEQVFLAPEGARRALGGAPFIPVRIPRRPSPRSLAEAHRLANALRPYGVDAVHSHSVATLPVALPLARWLDVPLIHSPHALPVRGLSGTWLEVQAAMGFVKAAGAAGASFISVSEGEYRTLSTVVGNRPNLLVLNPVPRRYLETARGAREPLTILSLSRFWAQKAPSLTVEAFAAVAAREPEARLIWAGDGPELDACRVYANNLGLADRISFLGRVADPLALLQRAPVFLSTSSFEAMPYSVLEAMATGALVVATDIPAHREIDAGLDALRLCPPDPAALGEAVLEALGDTPSANRQRSVARSLVERRNSIDGFAAAMASAYDRILVGATRGATGVAA